MTIKLFKLELAVDEGFHWGKTLYWVEKGERDIWIYDSCWWELASIERHGRFLKDVLDRCPYHKAHKVSWLEFLLVTGYTREKVAKLDKSLAKDMDGTETIWAIYHHEVE